MITSKQPDKPVARLSPFVIEKTVLAICGTPKTVKSLKSGSLLVECVRETQSRNLQKTTTFFDIPVQVSPHSSLNSSKGVIRCPSLHGDTEEAILDYFKSKNQHVTNVRRIKVKRDGELKDTNTFVLTFGVPELPKTVKVGFEIIKVDVYVPNPLRCFKCQQFGHHSDNCRRQEVCARCGQPGHSDDSFDCDSYSASCANCGANHPAYSRQCPAWLKEKEILKLKYTNNLTFPEARRMVEQRTPAGPSYSSIVKVTPTSNKVTVTDASTQPAKSDEFAQIVAAWRASRSKKSDSVTSETSKKPSSESSKTPAIPRTTPKEKIQLNSNRMKKGSNDPIKTHNKFGSLEEMDAQPSNSKSKPSKATIDPVRPPSH